MQVAVETFWKWASKLQEMVAGKIGLNMKFGLFLQRYVPCSVRLTLGTCKETLRRTAKDGKSHTEHF